MRSKTGTRVGDSSRVYMSGLYLVTRDLTLSRGWWFNTGADPTGGNVNYLSMQDAMDQGLAYVGSDNTLVLAIDSTSTVAAGGNRNA
jgi:hypothetical protein